MILTEKESGDSMWKEKWPWFCLKLEEFCFKLTAVIIRTNKLLMFKPLFSWNWGVGAIKSTRTRQNKSSCKRTWIDNPIG